MRRGEVLGLGWDALDLESGKLRVSRTLVVVDYKPTVSTPKTDRGRDAATNGRAPGDRVRPARPLLGRVHDGRLHGLRSRAREPRRRSARQGSCLQAVSKRAERGRSGSS